jgi:transcriptional regulator with XRE-family HTH domain
MNDTTWLAEDGRLLKDLRIAAGWDTHDFSRSASISVAQLRQLEDGGNELFYSQSIKFQLGRKLLKKLGADIVRTPEAAVAETPSLFGFSPWKTLSSRTIVLISRALHLRTECMCTTPET